MTTDRPSNEQTDEQATGLTAWSIPASHVLRQYLEAVRLGDPKEGWEVHEVHLVTAPRHTGAATHRVEHLDFNEVLPRLGGEVWQVYVPACHYWWRLR